MTYQIGIIGGDGIGPEVVREGLKVLTAASELFGFRVRLTDYPYGTNHFLKTGEEFPDRALSEMKQQDAILLDECTL